MPNPNYQLLMEKQMQTIPLGTQLLLHSCCGPCSSAVLERLAGHFAITLLFYNPNIWPREEYEHRKAEQLRLLTLLETPYPIAYLDSDYDTPAFYQAVKGHEQAPEGGSRCTECFALRLNYTARQASVLGIPWFTTTLSVSPHKNAPVLNQLGSQAAQQYGVGFLPADFKKKNGYKRSLELAKETGLYRQEYCGCAYSHSERFSSADSQK